jgi:hypothetical protein
MKKVGRKVKKEMPSAHTHTTLTTGIWSRVVTFPIRNAKKNVIDVSSSERKRRGSIKAVILG